MASRSGAEPPPLIGILAAIDAAWIGAVLGAPVTHVAVEPIGQGTTSAVARVTIDAGARRLVVKLPRAGVSDGGALGFAREVAAYLFLGDAPPLRIPRCHHAAIREDGLFNLVLDDLGEGHWPGDQIAGCSIAEARAVVAELAALHAAYVGDPMLASLEWPRRRRRGASVSAGFYARGAAAIGARLGAALDAECRALIAAAVPLVERWSAAATPHETLIHTDPRVDNIIFGPGDGGIVAHVIDLQQMAVGDPAYDLAYFLTGSLAPADRAACERDLVRDHAAVLRSAGAAIDDAAAWRAYRENALAGLVATVSAAATLPPDAAFDRLLLALVCRNCAAVGELDGLEAAEQRTVRGAAD